MAKKSGREQLTTWMRKQGKTKIWLARELGITETAVFRWLSGSRVPRITHLAALEKLTGIPASAWATEATREVA